LLWDIVTEKSPPKDFRLLRSVLFTSSLPLILVGEEVRRSSVPPPLRTLSSTPAHRILAAWFP
jgi:hypothetical protein